MSASVSDGPTPPIANSELATQIVDAMRAAGLVGPAEEAETMAMLTTKQPKAGEWRALLEKQLDTSLSTSSSHAAPDYGA